MARSANPLQRDTIQVVARDTGARLEASRSNSALQLAASLADINPQAQKFINQYGEQLKEESESEARRAVLENAGQKFADATREGKIEPTQNPWFMSAYNRESAAVRAQSDFAALQSEAAEWEEQSDPAAFQAKWQERVGQLSEAYGGADSLVGFEAIEAQATQQTLATNVSKNVQRIKEERVQNVQQLTTTAIQDAVAANGGVADPSRIWQATAAAKLQWLQTGGSEADWAVMEASSLTAAAYNTGNPAILDAIQDAKREGGALSGIAGVADQASADQYRIRQNANDKAMARVQAARAKVADEAETVVSWAYETFGDDLYTPGAFTAAEFREKANAMGFSPRAIAAAQGQLREDVGDSAGLQRSRLELNGSDPTMAREQVTLFAKGRKAGWSAAYEDEVGQAILTGRITADEGASMIAGSLSRTEQLKSEAKADAREAKADRRAAAAAARTDGAGTKLKSWTALNTQLANDAAYVTATAEKYASKPLNKTVVTERAKNAAVFAAQAHLGQFPNDFVGARAKGKAAAATVGAEEAAKANGTVKKPAGNNNRVPRGQ